MSNQLMKSEGTALAKLDGDIIASLVINGDLKALTAAQKVSYYNYRCSQAGLDPSAKPFDLLVLNGKHVLYANASCTQQLCGAHKLSTAITDRTLVEGIYTVSARVTSPDGRATENMGAVAVEGIKGEARSNAMMKATTKAIRRTVLAHCGLGMLDETEVETIPGAAKVHEQMPETINAEALETTDDEMIASWERELAKCKTVHEIMQLYNTNSLAIEADRRIKALLTERKKEIKAKEAVAA